MKKILSGSYYIVSLLGVLFVVGILAAMWYSHKLKLRNEAPFAITERL